MLVLKKESSWYYNFDLLVYMFIKCALKMIRRKTWYRKGKGKRYDDGHKIKESRNYNL